MDYSKQSREELINICKEKKIKGYSGKKKDDIIELIRKHTVSEKQDTGKFRINTKDQFYTNKMVAKLCIQRILDLFPSTSEYLWIEPSAGNGSFLHSIPASFKKIGLDIEPNAKDIKKQDFLTWTPPKDVGHTIIFGNPPFGRQSSIAKSFIAKSCKHADIIAFILPKSFTKPSMFNVFDLKFHLIETTELQKDSFLINNKKYDVPCIFQIWQKKESDRTCIEKVIPSGFKYVKPECKKYHIAFRRVGGLAGKCYTNNGTAYSPQSHYFIEFEDKYVSNIHTIMTKINDHVFPSNTVGPRSLSKSEINTVLNAILHSLA